MCCYKKYLEDGEMYQCTRENYKNSDFCVFHYGYEADLEKYNKDKITEKENDFNQVLEAYLNDTTLKTFNFIGTLFPIINFNERKFEREFDFSFAIFTEEVNFEHATFSKIVYFEHTTFSEKVNFLH